MTRAPGKRTPWPGRAWSFPISGLVVQLMLRRWSEQLCDPGLDRLWTTHFHRVAA